MSLHAHLYLFIAPNELHLTLMADTEYSSAELGCISYLYLALKNFQNAKLI